MVLPLPFALFLGYLLFSQLKTLGSKWALGLLETGLVADSIVAECYGFLLAVWALLILIKVRAELGGNNVRLHQIADNGLPIVKGLFFIVFLYDYCTR